MEQAVYDVYRDISARTGGEIYIGVVGPVRTGKSTFIKRFMETFVIPDLDENERTMARDELPMSAAGKTITTTEPKFIPKEGAVIHTADNIQAKIRLIDCVGYMVDGAIGHEENDEPRMVRTPWFEEEIPFVKAAEIGTRKVICDHSTIGMVMTGDGSFGELSPKQFEPALEKTINQLKDIHKPFIVLLNCENPDAAASCQLAKQIEMKHGVTVMRVNAQKLETYDISRILGAALAEFDIGRIDFCMPRWVSLLKNDHPVKKEVIETAEKILSKCSKMKDLEDVAADPESTVISGIGVKNRIASDGSVCLDMTFTDDSYFKMISGFSGMDIRSEEKLLTSFFDMSKKYTQYAQVETTLDQVKETGYSVLTPARCELNLSEPKLIKQGGKFGVKMKACAPSIHMIKTDIETEIAPIVGSEEQAQDLINYIKAAKNAGEGAVWSTNIFGKTIVQIVEDGMYAKINQMTQECRQKLQDAMAKIINDSSGGMVCIII